MRTKPPIGVLPKQFFNESVERRIILNGGVNLNTIIEERLNDLKGAISRYSEANLHINTEWIIEYNERLNQLGVKQNIFKL